MADGTLEAAIPSASHKQSTGLGSPMLGVPDRDLCLRVSAPDQESRLIRIRAGKCKIGSSVDCDLRIHGPQIQPVHGLLIRGVRGDFVRCVKSGGRHEFQDAELRPRDRLKLGDCELQVLDSTPNDGSAAYDDYPTAENQIVASIDARMRRLEEQLSQLQQRTVQVESDTLKEAAASFRNQLRIERENHSHEREELIAQRQQLADELENQSQRFTSLQADLQQLQSQLDACQAEADQRVGTLQGQVEQLAQERLETQRQHDAELRRWQAQKTQLDSELLTERDRQRESAERLAESSCQIAAGAEERDRLESVISDLSEAQERLREQLELSQADIRQRQEEWSALRKELEDALGLAESKAQEHTQLDAENKELLQQREDDWERDRTALMTQLTELEEVRQHEQQEAERLHEKCESLTTRIDELEQQIESGQIESVAEVAEDTPEDPMSLRWPMDRRNQENEPMPPGLAGLRF